MAKPCGLPKLIPLLLTISLQGIGLVEHRLRCLPYPKPSRAELALPRLSNADRNFNRFPFCAVGIAVTLRIALLWAEEHGPETRVLCGVEDSRLDMLLLVPRYSWQAGPRDVTAPLLTSPSAPLPNSRLKENSWVSVLGLAPIIFGICDLDWSAITRCLKDGCF